MPQRVNRADAAGEASELRFFAFFLLLCFFLVCVCEGACVGGWVAWVHGCVGCVVAWVRGLRGCVGACVRAGGRAGGWVLVTFNPAPYTP